MTQGGAPIAASSDTVYRALTAADVPSAARLHRRVFHDYFLGHMGQRFLELFYAEFVDKPGNYGYVAVADDRVVGAVIGSDDLARMFNDFYRGHFLRLAWYAYARLVRDPFVRRHVWARLPHVVKAVRSRLGIGADVAPDPLAWPNAQLLSIGVDPAHRGSGIAGALTDLFCERLAADGIDAVGLSVLTDNPRAIAFYEKNGWILQRSDGSSAAFYRALRPGAAPPR